MLLVLLHDSHFSISQAMSARRLTVNIEYSTQIPNNFEGLEGGVLNIDFL